MPTSLGGPDRQRRHDVMSKPTARGAMDLLRGADRPMSAREISDGLGLHHTGVRHHLAALRDCGLVQTERAPHAGRGRPTTLFRPVPDPDAQEAAGHAELVRMLMGLVNRMGLGPDDMEAFGVGQAHVVCRPGGGIDELTDAFARLGFAPRRVPGPAPNDIVLDHCPFAAGVEAPGGSLICALHRGLAIGAARISASGARVLELVEENPRTAGCLLRLAPEAA